MTTNVKGSYKRKSDILKNLEPIEVYNIIASGKLKKFPNDYLTKDIAKILVTYVIKDQLKYSREDICKKLNYGILSDNYLGGVRKLFDNCLFTMIDYVFKDDKIVEWELNKVSVKFWEAKENRIRFILWIAKKENLDIKKIEDAKKINTEMIRKYGGIKALRKPRGLFTVINEAASGIYKEWQFVKMNHWTEEKTLIAIKWLFDEKLKWTHEDICNNLTAQTFYDNDLGGLLSKTCGNSPFVALEKCYPGKYKKEDLKRGEKNRKSLEIIKKKKQKKACN